MTLEMTRFRPHGLDLFSVLKNITGARSPEEVDPEDVTATRSADVKDKGKVLQSAFQNI